MFSETTSLKRRWASVSLVGLLLTGFSSVPMRPEMLLGAEHKRSTPSQSIGRQVTGRVWALGKQVSGSRLPVFKNMDYCGASVPDQSLSVDPEGRLQAAAVLLEPIGRQVAVAPTRVVLDNRRCAFTPRVQIVPAGSSVVLKNSDPILHAVHARLGKETLFNVGLPTWRQVIQILKKPGIVAIDCDVLHTWMRAFVIVTLSPYFAVTDERGYFRINNVPAGFYDLVVWHEIFGRKTRQIRVTKSEAMVFDVIYGTK